MLRLASRSQRRWAVGVLMIVVVACIWTFSSVLVQLIFRMEKITAPFFLTYVFQALFMVNLPIVALRHVFKTKRGQQHEDAEDMDGRAALTTCPTPLSLTPGVYADEAHGVAELQPSSVPLLGIPAHFVLSARIAPSWFLANWAYNWSLSRLTVTASTMISTTSCMWTYMLSVFCMGEAASRRKTLGVLFCMIGNAISAYSVPPSYGDQKSTVEGVIACIFGALMYGVYTTMLQREISRCGGDDVISMALFFGGLGLITSLTLAPVVLLLHVSGLEALNGLSPGVWGFLILKGLLDNVISDYLWAKAVLYTSATVATVGLSLTIPLALPADTFFGSGGAQSVLNPYALTAAVLVLAGFGLLTL